MGAEAERMFSSEQDTDVPYEDTGSSVHIPDPHPRDVRRALDRFVVQTLRPVSLILAIIFFEAAIGHWVRRDQPMQDVVGLYDLAGVVVFVAMFAVLTRRSLRPKWGHPVLGGIAFYVLVGNILHLWLFTSPTTVVDFILLVFGLGVLILSIPWFVALTTITVLSWVLLASQVFSTPVFESFTTGLVQATAIAALLFFLRFHTHSRLERLRMRDAARQERLEHAVRSLHQADESRSELLRTIVHDMASPVTTLKGVLLAARAGGPAPAEGEKPRRLMAHSIERLESFLEDLRELDAIESGRFDVDRVPVDVEGVVRAATEAYEPAAAEKGLDLSLDVSGPLPVEGDRRHLERVMTNLVGNAVKFTDSGGIEVWARQRDDEVELVVRDTGRGMEPAETEEVFEPFRRLRHAGEKKVQGSGLGLHICRQIVEAHGGRIEAESEGLGKGTTFRVRLPKAPTGTAGPGPAAEAQRLGDGDSHGLTGNVREDGHGARMAGHATARGRGPSASGR